MGNTNKTANIAMVDKGHQKLSEIHTHIKALINDKGNKNDLTEIFFSLSYFYENYLINEELFLKKTGYPNLESHRASHKEFIHEIVMLKDGINNDTTAVLKELDGFITKWLNDHEATYNADLMKFLKGKGLLQG